MVQDEIIVISRMPVKWYYSVRHGESESATGAVMCTGATSVSVHRKALRTLVVRKLPSGAEAGFRAVQWRYLNLLWQRTDLYVEVASLQISRSTAVVLVSAFD